MHRLWGQTSKKEGKILIKIDPREKEEERDRQGMGETRRELKGWEGRGKEWVLNSEGNTVWISSKRSTQQWKWIQDYTRTPC